MNAYCKICAIALLFIIVSIQWSCTPEIVTTQKVENGEISLRSTDCLDESLEIVDDPDCYPVDDVLPLIVSINGCNYTVEMYVTKCDRGGVNYFDYHFEENRIIPSPGCPITEEIMDQAYDLFVADYMDHHATIITCGEGGTTTSVYTKMDCVKSFIGFSDGVTPGPVIFRSCGESSGCCTTKTFYCRNWGVVEVKDVKITESPGVCDDGCFSRCGTD